MQKEDIRIKTAHYFEQEGFILPKNVFRDFFSQLIKLAGFGLGGMFVLSGKKAGKKAASHIKELIGENLSLDDVRECIIAYFEESKQCIVKEFTLTESTASLKLEHSVFAEGIESKKPTCLPLGGTIAGMLEEFLGGSWEPKETQCIAQGFSECFFEVKRK
jgi:predicted hydrocarbon binding protein